MVQIYFGLGQILILRVQDTSMNKLRIRPDPDPTSTVYLYELITNLNPTCTVNYYELITGTDLLDQYELITDSARSRSCLYRIPEQINYGLGRIRILPVQYTGTK